MNRIAIIPARGGSKRIPRKNIRQFLGKPIIAYSIEAARSSGLFSEIIVSTDDQEIGEVARQYGASVPFYRSEGNSSDYATTADVLLEVMSTYAEEGIYYELGCCIYPTAPFVQSIDLIQGLKELQDRDLDFVFPVVQYSSAIQRALRLNSNNFLEMFNPEYLSTRSQDLEKAYHDSGQFYWFRTSALKREGKLWGSRAGAIVISEMKVHDIDTEEDWKFAESKYRYNFEL